MTLKLGDKAVPPLDL